MALVIGFFILLLLFAALFGNWWWLMFPFIIVCAWLVGRQRPAINVTVRHYDGNDFAKTKFDPVSPDQIDKT